MSTLTTVQRFVGTTIIEGLVSAGLAIDAEPIIYHGVEPDDCCPSQGAPPRVVVWWDQMGYHRRPVSSSGGSDCGGGGILVDFGIRLLTCWPVPHGGIAAPSDIEYWMAVDETTDYLTRASYVGYLALSSKFEVCGTSKGRFGQRTVISPTLGIKEAWLYPSKPRAPKGGCAGIDWKVSLVPSGTETALWAV